MTIRIQNIWTILIVLAIFSPVLFPGQKIANDFPVISPSLAQESLSPPSVWNLRGSNAWGEYTPMTLWSWPIDIMYGSAIWLGLDPSIPQKIFGFILPLLISWVGWQKVAKSFSRSSLLGSIAWLSYVCAPYMLQVVDGGQLSLFLAYALLPLLASQYIDRKHSGFIVTLIGISFSDLRVVLLAIAIVGGIKLLKNDKLEGVKNDAKLIICSGIILLLLHLYWLIPTFLGGLSTVYNFLTSANQVSQFSFSSLGHGLLLQPIHWPKNSFGEIQPLRIEFIVFPYLFFYLVYKLKTKKFLYIAILFLVGVFLQKGNQFPFGGIYVWLYEKLPGFSLFRDSSKFMLLSVFSFSILLLQVNKMKAKYLSYVLGLYFIIVALPLLQKQSLGMWGYDPRTLEFTKLNQEINKSDSGNILWLPQRPGLGGGDSDHRVLESLRLLDNRIFTSQRVGEYESLNFITMSPAMKNILEFAHVSGIAYPAPDPRKLSTSTDEIKYHSLFTNFLPSMGYAQTNHPWLLRTTVPYPDMYIPKHVYLMAGGYKEVAKHISSDPSSPIINLLDYPGLGSQLKEHSNKLNLIGDQSLVAFSFVSPDHYKPLVKLAGSDWWYRPTQDYGWVTNFIENKYHMYTDLVDLGNGFLIAEGQDKQLKLDIKPGEDQLSLLLLKSNFAGQLVIENGGKQQIISTQKNFLPVAKIISDYTGYNKETEYVASSIEPVNINNLVPGEIKISFSGTITVITSIAGMPSSEFDKLGKSTVAGADENNISDVVADLSSKKISSTKYLIDIKSLNKPGFMVFANSWDNRWRLNGQAAIPLLGFLNTFYISQPGRYVLEFESQKYVWWPWLISLTSGVCLLIGACVKRGHKGRVK